MFNHSNCGGYSLADIAAATGGANNGAFGDNSSWWVILLFILLLSGNNNWGWNNEGGGANPGYVLTSDFANLERKLDSVNSGLCDGFYAMNTGMLNGFSGVNSAITQQTITDMQNTNALGAQMTALGTQLSSCCCDLKGLLNQNFCQLNYNLADQSCETRRAIADSTRDIIASQEAGTRSILDFLTQDKIATLTAENQTLKFAASQAAQNAYLTETLMPKAPVPAYVVPNPFAGCYTTKTVGCGSCC